MCLLVWLVAVVSVCVCMCVCVCVYYFACVWLGVGLAGGFASVNPPGDTAFLVYKMFNLFPCVGIFTKKVVAKKSLDYESLR